MLQLAKRLSLGIAAFTVGAIVITVVLCRRDGEASYEIG